MHPPKDLETLHDEMDALAMRLLDLSQELVIAKLKLEQHTKEGHFLLSKSR